MRKKVCTLSLLLAALCLTGCRGNPPQEAKESWDNLPETLSVTAEFPQNFPETASVYQAQWYEAEEEPTVELLMRREPTERQDLAEGPAYYCYEGETVIENLLFKTGVSTGGLRYQDASSVPRETQSDMESLRKWDLFEESGRGMAPQTGWDRLLDYPAQENLDFLPFGDAKAAVEQIMEACLFPETSLSRSEVHSLERLEENRNIYNEICVEKDFAEGQLGELPPNAAHYWFRYEQVLNGIPLADRPWRKDDLSSVYPTSVTAQINADGLFKLDASNLCLVGDAQKEVALLSPEEAFWEYADWYSQSLHVIDTVLAAVELNYIFLEQGNPLTLRPAWMLFLRIEDIDPNGEIFWYSECIAVDAETGVLYGLEKKL